MTFDCFFPFAGTGLLLELAFGVGCPLFAFLGGLGGFAWERAVAFSDWVIDGPTDRPDLDHGAAILLRCAALPFTVLFAIGGLVAVTLAAWAIILFVFAFGSVLVGG